MPSKDALHYFKENIEKQAIFMFINTKPRFPLFYYIYDANLGLLLHGAVPVMYLLRNCSRKN